MHSLPNEKLIEILQHVDAADLPHVLSTCPRFHALLKAFHAKTELPVVINTSLNRRGEPVVCTPDDALAMFFGSGLEFMVLEDTLIQKRALTGPPVEGAA